MAAHTIPVRAAEEGDRRPLALLFAAVAEERDGIAAEPPIDVEKRAASLDLDRTLVAFDGQAWTSSTLPGAGRLNAIHGLSKDDVWVVGAQGQVFHYDGTSFKPVELSLPKVDLLAVRAIAPNQILVSGAGGALYSYDGQTWKTRASGVAGDLFALVAAERGDVLSVGEHGAVVRWSGEQRTLFTSGGSANYLDVFGAPGASSLFVVGDEALRREADGYVTLEVESQRSLYDGFALNKDLAWAVGTEGTIVRWDGSRFGLLESGSDRWLRGVWAASPSSVWAVGAAGTVLGLFNGTSWQAMPVPADKDLYDVWGSATDDVWAAGDAGSILHWDGTRWTVVPANVADVGLRGVWGSASDDVWAVGTLGTILHWSGSAWTISQKGAGYSLHGVWGAAKGDLYAVGSAGTILHYDGSTWTPERAPADVTLFAVGAAGDGIVRAVGESGVILYKR